MKTTVLFIMLITPAAWPQANVEFMSAKPNLARLYERVSRSEFVIIGRAAERKAIEKRTFREGLERQKAAGARALQLPLDELMAGWLVTVDVEKTLCRSSDFLPTPSSRQQALVKAYVFYPANEGSIPSELDRGLRTPAESLLPGKRYLLYLYQPGDRMKLTDEYVLDPTLTYYRAFEGARGAREIPAANNGKGPKDFVTPAVAAIDSYCEAVNTPDLSTKVARLKTLQLKAEPYWRDSIDRAIQALEGARAR
jgi:hypothetical protein